MATRASHDESDITAGESWSRDDRPAAVVPVFEPDSEVVSNLARLATQVSQVIVIDDSGQGASWLRGRLPENALLLENDENSGQAHCLNVGVQVAMAGGARRIATFDQDTRVPDGYVVALTAHLDRVQAASPDALVAGPNRGAALGHEWAGGWCSLGLVQSGLLFDARAFDRIGMFLEHFFIDGVEQEYLLRLHRHGFHTTVCLDLDLPHVEGRPRMVAFLGRQLPTSDHAPFRRYYAWRNHLTWIRDYWHDEPAFCRADLRWLFGWTARALMFENQRWANLRAVLYGVLDFARGRFGKFPA